MKNLVVWIKMSLSSKNEILTLRVRCRRSAQDDINTFNLNY
jgi:hypothetical protein